MDQAKNEFPNKWQPLLGDVREVDVETLRRQQEMCIRDRDWDGADWAEEFDPAAPPIADRIGQEDPQDVEEYASDRQENSAKGVVGDNRYLETWPSIASMIRQRDRHTCQRCGINLSGKGRLLHVHHLDGDRLNNDPSNLMSLCVICHSDRERHQHLCLLYTSRCV